jgi:hypothetical protein
MPQISLKQTPRISLVGKSVLLLILGICVLVSSCDGPRTSWSAESRSPDGKMIARASTVQTSGIGTGNPGTFVYLNWTTGSQSPTMVLAFHEGPDEPGGMNVGMNWLGPTHLELTYKGHRSLDFQAVKCDGIDISVRDLSNSTTNSSR